MSALTHSAHWVFFSPKNDARRHLKKCTGCKHFRTAQAGGEDAYSKARNDEHGWCGLFGHINSVDGEEKYFPAVVARGEKSLCSDAGLYFDARLDARLDEQENT